MSHHLDFEIDVLMHVRSTLIGRAQVKASGRKVIRALLRQKSLPKKARCTLLQSRQITLVFVGENTGRDLNLQFRHRDYATDVLSFAPVLPESLGELVFCVPVLRLQAREHGLTFDQELMYMLIHGVLHLLGYDHEANDRRAKDMYRLQDQLFGSFYGHRNRTVRRKK